MDVRCKLETRFEEAEWRQKSEEKRDQKKCNGLILFLAELVAQMDESFAFTLGEILVWFITKILQRPASNSVKYICQALKVSCTLTMITLYNYYPLFWTMHIYLM